MAKELKAGCARPTGGPVGERNEKTEMNEMTEVQQEGKAMIQVGRMAPDFTAPGYHNNTFVSMQLSEYLGKWVLLCFYPGDFTFV